MKILAVASSGGHWVQLSRMVPAFSMHRIHFASTELTISDSLTEGQFHLLPDANIKNFVKVLYLAIASLFLVIRIRPDLVISTGAAPGLLCICWGKIFGARTIWVDSIANAEEFSFSGKLAKKFADEWITQWHDVAKKSGAKYIGNVL